MFYLKISLAAFAPNKLQPPSFQQLRLFPLARRRIRSDLISTFKNIHGLLKFFMESASINPTHTEQFGHAYKLHEPRYYMHRRQHAFSVPFVCRDCLGIVSKLLEHTSER